MRSEFEEKSYETAANIEFGRRGDVFSPGQVLEGILGYDAALRAHRDHRIWSVLQTPRPPGIRLTTDHWLPGEVPPPASLPSSPISLIVQYKRPEYLRVSSAKQWKLWRSPYFRFTLDAPQHQVLTRLERSLGERALVRYASPAFWQISELENAHLPRRVLSLTGFARPTDIGRHSVWTYVKPGISGKPNPSGADRPFETIEELMSYRRSERDELTQRDSLVLMDGGSPALPEGWPTHIAKVAAIVLKGQSRLRSQLREWGVALYRGDTRLSDAEIGLVLSLAAIVTAVSATGATWLLQVGERPATGSGA